MTQLKNYKSRKSFGNYFDVSLAFINFLVIIFPLVLFNKNIFISIIGIILSGVLIEKTIYNFMKNNPFYIDYCYGLLICGFLSLFPSTAIFPIIGFLFLPEIGYCIYNMLTSKGENSGVSNIPRNFILGRSGG